MAAPNAELLAILKGLPPALSALAHQIPDMIQQFYDSMQQANPGISQQQMKEAVTVYVTDMHKRFFADGSGNSGDCAAYPQAMEAPPADYMSPSATCQVSGSPFMPDAHPQLIEAPPMSYASAPASYDARFPSSLTEVVPHASLPDLAPAESPVATPTLLPAVQCEPQGPAMDKARLQAMHNAIVKKFELRVQHDADLSASETNQSIRANQELYKGLVYHANSATAESIRRTRAFTNNNIRVSDKMTDGFCQLVDRIGQGDLKRAGETLDCLSHAWEKVGGLASNEYKKEVATLAEGSDKEFKKKLAQMRQLHEHKMQQFQDRTKAMMEFTKQYAMSAAESLKIAADAKKCQELNTLEVANTKRVHERADEERQSDLAHKKASQAALQRKVEGMYNLEIEKEEQKTKLQLEKVAALERNFAEAVASYEAQLDRALKEANKWKKSTISHHPPRKIFEEGILVNIEQGHVGWNLSR